MAKITIPLRGYVLPGLASSKCPPPPPSCAPGLKHTFGGNTTVPFFSKLCAAFGTTLLLLHEPRFRFMATRPTISLT